MSGLFAIPFPALDPVLIEFGPFAIRWYALAYIAGLVMGWFIATRLTGRPGLFAPAVPPTRADLDDMLVYAALGIVLGGRAGFVLFYNLDYYLANPIEIPQLWKGGMAFHGGAAGLILATWLYARSRAVSFLTLMDVITVVAPAGLFFGRIANFINSELYGRVTDVSWAMVFPRDPTQLPRHPSQLYEAGLEGLLLFIILAALVFGVRALARPGFIGGTFLLGYGLARFTVEFFREPDIQVGYLAGGLTMGQYLSTPMVFIGIGVMIWAWRRAKT